MPRETKTRKTTPLSRVYNMDLPQLPPRLVSLPPREAVVYCYASDMGDLDNPRFKNQLVEIDAWWICGYYKASEKEYT